MSKELNIIEASALKNTEFKLIYPSGKQRIKNVYCNDIGSLEEIDGNELYTFTDILNAIFIPIQQPVSFIEAITQNHYNNKTIRCEIADKIYTYKPEEIKIRELRAIETHGGISTEEILNGKWYIED